MPVKMCEDFINMSPFDERYPIHLFPFDEMCSLKATEYEKVSLIIKKLKTYIGCKELFDKSNVYLSCTLDFILTRSNFMMKDNTHQHVFRDLLELLGCVIDKFLFEYVTSIYVVEIKQILNMLFDLIDSFQPLDIKEIGCRFITPLIQFSNVDISKLFNIYPTILNVFETTNRVSDMGEFFCSILRRNLSKSSKTATFLNCVETRCVTLLEKQIRDEEVMQLLKCVVLLYMKEDENLYVTQNCTIQILLRHSGSICTYANQENFRAQTNYLLSIIILKSNCLNLGRKFNSILKQVEDLPTFYEDWPFSDNDMFFVIAHILLINDFQPIWSSESILSAINKYLTNNSLTNPEILRAILLLYSTLSSNSIANTSNSEKMLFNTLSTYNSLSDVLILDGRIITWILRSAEHLLKARVIKWMFAIKTNEEQLIKVIEKSQLGHYLVKFLLDNFDAPISSKVSQIVANLTPDVRLSEAVYAAIPQLCNRPDILGNLLRMQEQQFPKNMCDVKNYIQIIFIALPFLNENESIIAACSYIKNLLNVTISNINIERNYLFNSLNCLISHAATENDKIAIEAIELVNELLLKDQICVVSKTADIIINVPVIDILQGSNKRIEGGLKLLFQLLEKVDNKLYLACSQKLFRNLYTHLHSLVNLNTVNTIFRILKLLLAREPNLSFSMSTPLLLQLVYTKYLNKNTEKSYKDFLKVWQELKGENVSF